MNRKALLVGVSAIALAAAGTAAYVAPLTAEPRGSKDCASALPMLPGVGRSTAVPEPTWFQRGGTVNDASCLSRTAVAGVVRPTSDAQVAAALGYARAKGLTVSAAGDSPLVSAIRHRDAKAVRRP